MFETIKLIIIALLAAGLIAAFTAGYFLWRNILSVKKDCEDALADNVLTDQEYIQIGKDTVEGYKNAKTIWDFLKSSAISIAGVLSRAKLRAKCQQRKV